jgi:hypothetical protein
MIFRYAPDWRYLGHISHPSCAAIHDIEFDRETLWVSSARNDMLFQFSLDGGLLGVIYMRTAVSGIPALAWNAPALLSPEEIRAGRLEFRDPSTHSQLETDRAHVNSVCALPDGGILASLGQLVNPRYAAWLRVKQRLIALGLWRWILRINRGIQSGLGLEKDLHSDLLVRPASSDAAVLHFPSQGDPDLCLRIPNVTAPCHSLMSLPDHTALYLNTTTGSVIHFHPLRREIISSTHISDGFLRGMTRMDDGSIVIGSSTALLRYDPDDRLVRSQLLLSTEANESVFDIERLPAHFSLPPSSFRDHWASAVGVSPEELLRVEGSASPHPVDT